MKQESDNQAKKEKEESEEEIKRKEAEAAAKAASKSGKIGELTDKLVTRQGVGTEKVVKQLISKVVDDQQMDGDEEQPEEEPKQDEEADDPMLAPEEKSELCVEAFFEKFKVNSEGSATADNVDITLLLQAVPDKVLTYNVG